MKTNGEKNELLLNTSIKMGYDWTNKKQGNIGTVWVGHRWCEGSKMESRPHHACMVVFESDRPKEMVPITFCPLDAITTEQARMQICFDYASEYFGVIYG